MRLHTFFNVVKIELHWLFVFPMYMKCNTDVTRKA